MVFIAFLSYNMKLHLYEPHINQQKIHESAAKYRTVVAGRRFGKSALALNECLARAFQIPNQICWIILPLMKQAKEIYWIDPDVTRYFIPYVQEGLIKMDSSELSLKVIETNSWIRLKGSDNYEGLRGSGLDLIVWDEVDDVKPLAFETIKPALADSPRHRQLFIGTPKGQQKLHEFALKGDHLGIIPRYDSQIQPNEDWQTWHFTSYDNMTWPDGSFERETFVKYIDQQKKEAEEKGDLIFFNQEYLASFQQAAGTVFKEFSKRLHVIPPVSPVDEGDINLSMDWGYSENSAFSCHAHKTLKTVYDGQTFNRIVTFKEWYGNLKSPEEWAEIIMSDLRELGMSPKKGYTDPAMHNTQTDGSISISKLMMDYWKKHGFSCQLIRANNNRIARVATTHNWLKIAPDGLPYWEITENNKNLIRTLPILVYDKHKREDVDTSQEDHAWDDTSYNLVMNHFTQVKPGSYTAIAHEKKRQLPVDSQGYPTIDPKTFFGSLS